MTVDDSHGQWPFVHRHFMPMKTLIIGLGNPILGDDGVGWKIAKEVEKRLLTVNRQSSIVTECLSLAGISLMEQIVGYQRVILIDSLNTGQHPQGTVVTFTLNDLPDLTYGHSASAHDLSLKNALKLGRSMGAELPRNENVIVVAIEAAHVYDFTEELTPAIAKIVPEAVDTVMKLLVPHPNLTKTSSES
jgi:hydrogenase maturation protease